MFAGTGGLTVTAIIRIVSGSIKNTPMVSVISRFSLRPAHAVQAQAVGFFLRRFRPFSYPPGIAVPIVGVRKDGRDEPSTTRARAVAVQ